MTNAPRIQQLEYPNDALCHFFKSLGARLYAQFNYLGAPMEAYDISSPVISIVVRRYI